MRHNDFLLTDEQDGCPHLVLRSLLENQKEIGRQLRMEFHTWQRIRLDWGAENSVGLEITSRELNRDRQAAQDGVPRLAKD